MSIDFSRSPLPDAKAPFKPFDLGRTAARNEKARRFVVRLVTCIYLLAIFEGILRKWALPQFNQYLYFVRDPLVMWTYVLATQHHLWPKNSKPLQVSFIIMAVGLLAAIAQLCTNGFESSHLLFAVYGWRNYFFYLPLTFLIGAQFKEADIKRVLRLTLWLALPIALLVVIQFKAPVDSTINIGSATDVASQFRGLVLNGEHTRPMGTFTSILGQSMFTASAFAVLLALFIAPAKTRPTGRLVLVFAAAAILTQIALGGSRYTLIHCGLIIVAAMLLGLMGKGFSLKWRALILPAALALVAAILYPVIFPEGYAAMVERWTDAGGIENQQYVGGVFGRAVYGLFDFARVLNLVPTLGYGLGYGGNASTTLGATTDGVTFLSFAETDWSRHIVDLGPAFGIGFILFRIWLTVWLMLRVVRATRKYANPLPILLFGFVGTELLYGQATGHGTVNVYVWLFTGLCIASMEHLPVKKAIRVKTKTAQRQPASPLVAFPAI